ncbi:MAG: aspartate carbamoyltransferase [Clostridia bacterium]|nr:aspartate carbamoyltransferase [Clostridia bacterium]
MRNLIDITDLTNGELQGIMDTACDIILRPDDYREKCRGKKLATLFFEPSTRTRLSFEAAMYELGGNVIGFSDAGSSSVMKGETLADTAKVIGSYADVIAMRHPKDGAAFLASQYAGVPLINAGDGGHCHPTQTLADLLTIYRAKGGFNGLTVGFCGDLKYGRTVHSLIAALARYEGVKAVLISPEELRLPDYIKTGVMAKANMGYEEVGSIGEAIDKLDVLYMTRIQRERFADPGDLPDLDDDFMLTAAKMKAAKPDMCVLHPLPRVNEISTDVDDDKRAQYFEQVKNGKFMRMALILFLLERLGESERETDEKILSDDSLDCTNARCITHFERAYKPLFVKKPDGKITCKYCESEIS